MEPTVQQVKQLEEEERARRIAQDKDLDNLEKERSKTDLAHTIIREEEERVRRISLDKYLDEVEEERRKDDQAYCIIAEEEEKQRRVAEDDYLIDLEAKRRQRSKYDVLKAEEEERDRRVTENNLADQKEREESLRDRNDTRIMEEKEKERRVRKERERIQREQEQRLDAKAEVIIKEEEERARRVSLDQYLDEVEKERSLTNQAYSRIEEEDEKSRRMSEQEYQKSLPGAPSVPLVPAILPEITRKVPLAPSIEEQRATLPEVTRKAPLAPSVMQQQPSVSSYEQQQIPSYVQTQQPVPSYAYKQLPSIAQQQQSPVSSCSCLNQQIPTASYVQTQQPVPSIAQKQAPSVVHYVQKQPQYVTHVATFRTHDIEKEPERLPRAVSPTLNLLPLVVVFGGTGNQGKSVLKSLLAEGKWRLRTLTRNPLSKRAVKLSQRGIEIFSGDMHLETDLRRVLQGAYGVFAVTNYWDPQTTGKEQELGCKMARISKELGVSHYIWSTTPNAEKISRGKYRVSHLTDKAKVNKYIKTLGFNAYTFLVPAFFYQNFATVLPPRKELDGKLIWTIPMPESSYLTGFDVRDIGPMTSLVFNNKELFNRRKINLAGDNMHPQDYIIKLAYISRLAAKVELISPGEFARSKNPFAEELAEMFAFFMDFGYFGKGDWTQAKKLCPQIKSWEEYLRRETRSVQAP